MVSLGRTALSALRYVNWAVCVCGWGGGGVVGGGGMDTTSSQHGVELPIWTENRKWLSQLIQHGPPLLSRCSVGFYGKWPTRAVFPTQQARRARACMCVRVCQCVCVCVCVLDDSAYFTVCNQKKTNI